MAESKLNDEQEKKWNKQQESLALNGVFSFLIGNISIQLLYLIHIKFTWEKDSAGIVSHIPYRNANDRSKILYLS